MSRVVRCSLIQATNVEPAEKSLAEIKKVADGALRQERLSLYA